MPWDPCWAWPCPWCTRLTLSMSYHPAPRSVGAPIRRRQTSTRPLSTERHNISQPCPREVYWTSIAGGISANCLQPNAAKTEFRLVRFVSNQLTNNGNLGPSLLRALASFDRSRMQLIEMLGAQLWTQDLSKRRQNVLQCLTRETNMLRSWVMWTLTYNERVQDGIETAVNCQRLMVGVDAEDTLNNAQIGLQCVQL